MSVSPLVAIANGQKNTFQASKVLYNGFVLSTAAAICIAVILISTQNILFHLGQDVEVARHARPYYELMVWSLVPMIIFSAVKQFCDALEFTQTAMLLSILSLPVNACLNWIFIYGKMGFARMELTGAGLGTLITRTLIALILILIVAYHRLFLPYIKLRTKAWKISWKTCKELLGIGVPSSLQYGLEAGAFSVSGIMIGWLGATAQAAHQIALNVASATFMAALGLSLGGSIRVANAYGRNDRLQMRNIGVSTIAGGLAYGLICGLLFIAFQHQLPFTFTNNPQVASIASTLLIMGAIFQISDATQAIGVGLLRGIKDAKIPTLFVAIAYWIIGIPVGYFLSFQFGMGPSGIWIGFITGLTVSSILLNGRFLKKSKVAIV
jgi:MATE family multidrug resistance protein